MSYPKKIKSALISVFDKTGLEEIVQKLAELGVQILSTGGTYQYIKGLGIEVQDVEDITSYPAILGGRVKTLHPKIFGGILNRRANAGDQAELVQYEIPSIDLVIVDLYPFEKTVASGSEEQAIIEKIDIGGISLIRAAAKNFKDVVVVPSKAQYKLFYDELVENEGSFELASRKTYAAYAFEVSSHYDSAIYNYFSQKDDNKALKISVEKSTGLRYGENPHQAARFYGDIDDMFEKLHGKEISYNNLLDIDAAVQLINEFEETTCAILKHNNACGLASRPSLPEAWKAALEGDPVSAFGGVIIVNKKVDKSTAELMNSLFFEVIIAPAYDEEALKILKSKKNRIILEQKNTEVYKQGVRTVLNGYLVQQRDSKTETSEELECKTSVQPTADEIEDLLFANKIVKHSKSNAIVLAKNKQLIASGIGQTSRVDALKQSIEKAKHFNFDLKDAVMASDAFFPFADSVEIAFNAGVKSVIQPGGSVRDQETIDFCEAHGMPMVFTGIRHFKH
jgi:phosphoribosylaminoimidazolecarboxamide formyltransferase/IMP cyclohydrolase